MDAKTYCKKRAAKRRAARRPPYMGTAFPHVLTSRLPIYGQGAFPYMGRGFVHISASLLPIYGQVGCPYIDNGCAKQG